MFLPISLSSMIFLCCLETLGLGREYKKWFVLQIILNPIATTGLIVTAVNADKMEGLNLAVVITTSTILGFSFIGS
jgi:hypothetical protein